MFGNLGNMGSMLKQAQEFSKNLNQIKSELGKEEYLAESEGVKVNISGDMELKSISISPALIADGNFPRLELCVKDALNKALKNAKEGVANKFKKITGGLSIPGLF